MRKLKIESKKEKETQEDEPRKSFKEIIAALYNIFVEPPNLNNPRYRNILTGNNYTLNFLSYRLGIGLKDTYELFKNMVGCNVVFNKTKRLYELVIVDHDKFKEHIKKQYLGLYTKSLDNFLKLSKQEHNTVRVLNSEPHFSETKSRPQVLKPELLEETFSRFGFSPFEIQYLMLILKYNPTGEFSILQPRIPRKVFTENPELYLSKRQRLNLIDRCKNLGIIKIVKGKCRFIF